MAKDGRVKLKCFKGPYSGEYIWLAGRSLEFKVTKRTTSTYLKRHSKTEIYQGYYVIGGETWGRTCEEAVWVDTTPINPTYQFESRENINGFSNGL